MNSGGLLSEQGVSINVVGSSGTFDIGFSNDFVGTIVSSDFTSLGGTAVVDGYFDASAASFFGVDPSTELTGILTLELGQGQPGGAGNDIGLGTFVFGPNTATPEPPVGFSSVWDWPGWPPVERSQARAKGGLTAFHDRIARDFFS